MGACLAGTHTGIVALTLQDKNYNSLKADVNEYIQHLVKSISNLESNVDSLASVVFQNRQWLGLLFLQQGRLCAALHENLASM